MDNQDVEMRLITATQKSIALQRLAQTLEARVISLESATGKAATQEVAEVLALFPVQPRETDVSVRIAETNKKSIALESLARKLESRIMSVESSVFAKPESRKSACLAFVQKVARCCSSEMPLVNVERVLQREREQAEASLLQHKEAHAKQIDQHVMEISCLRDELNKVSTRDANYAESVRAYQLQLQQSSARDALHLQTISDLQAELAMKGDALVATMSTATPVGSATVYSVSTLAGSASRAITSPASPGKVSDMIFSPQGSPIAATQILSPLGSPTRKPNASRSASSLTVTEVASPRKIREVISSGYASPATVPRAQMLSPPRDVSPRDTLTGVGCATVIPPTAPLTGPVSPVSPVSPAVMQRMRSLTGSAASIMTMTDVASAFTTSDVASCPQASPAVVSQVQPAAAASPILSPLESQTRIPGLSLPRSTSSLRVTDVASPRKVCEVKYPHYAPQVVIQQLQAVEEASPRRYSSAKEGLSMPCMKVTRVASQSPRCSSRSPRYSSSTQYGSPANLQQTQATEVASPRQIPSSVGCSLVIPAATLNSFAFGAKATELTSPAKVSGVQFLPTVSPAVASQMRSLTGSAAPLMTMTDVASASKIYDVVSSPKGSPAAASRSQPAGAASPVLSTSASMAGISGASVTRSRSSLKVATVASPITEPSVVSPRYASPVVSPVTVNRGVTPVMMSRAAIYDRLPTSGLLSI